MRRGALVAALLLTALTALPDRPAHAASCGGAVTCRCGDTVTADYALTADLGPCSGHGLLVKSHATLDCQGRRISGTGSGIERYGVYVRGDTGAEVRGAVVRGCQITGFHHGIRLRAAEDSLVLENRIHANGDFGSHAGYGIDVTVGSKNNLIQDNVIDDNADEGIHLASGTGQNQLVGNVLAENFREQIYLLESHGNVLVGNVTSGAGSNSLYLKDSWDNYLEANTFADRPARVTGNASANVLVNNVFDRAQLQFHVYDASPDRIPSGNTVVGGSMTNPTGTCLRFVSALDNVAADVALASCATGVASEGTATQPSSNTLVSMAPGKVSTDAHSALTTSWWLSVRVENSAGAPVAGARVVIVDVLGATVADLVTGADGALPPQPLAEAVQVGGLVTARTPHALYTSHPAFLANVRTVGMTGDTAVVIALSGTGVGDGGGGDGGGGDGGDGGGGGGGGGAGTFFDDFARADSDSLGNGWVETLGDLAIADGSLRSGPAKGYSMAVLPGLDATTQSVAADFVSTANDTRPRFGLVLRYQDPRNYYAAYRQVAGSSMLRIVRVSNGTETVLASMSYPKPAVNTPFRLGARGVGPQLELTLDGTPMLSATDAAFATGSVGLILGSQSTTKVYRADNFAASLE